MTYPNEPGFRKQAGGETTSRDAATKIRPKAQHQAQLALGVIREQGKASPEEIHAILKERGIYVLLTSLRARCTQMHKRGELRPSGEHGMGESGWAKVIKWECDPDYTPPPKLKHGQTKKGDAE